MGWWYPSLPHYRLTLGVGDTTAFHTHLRLVGLGLGADLAFASFQFSPDVLELMMRMKSVV
jgi:hypothetical protein